MFLRNSDILILISIVRVQELYQLIIIFFSIRIVVFIWNRFESNVSENLWIGLNGMYFFYCWCLLNCLKNLCSVWDHILCFLLDSFSANVDCRMHVSWNFKLYQYCLIKGIEHFIMFFVCCCNLFMFNLTKKITFP